MRVTQEKLDTISDLFLEYVDKYNMIYSNQYQHTSIYYIPRRNQNIYYDLYYVDDFLHLTIGMRNETLNNIPDFGKDMNNFIKRLSLFDILCDNKENVGYSGCQFFTYRLFEFKLKEL